MVILTYLALIVSCGCIVLGVALMGDALARERIMMPPRRPRLQTYEVTYTYTACLLNGTYAPASNRGRVEAANPVQAASKLTQMLEAWGHKEVEILSLTLVDPR